MPITIDKIKEAQEKLNKVQIAASQINEILVLATDGLLEDSQGNEVIPLTADQKTSLLAEYNTRKTALQTAVSELL